MSAQGAEAEYLEIAYDGAVTVKTEIRDWRGEKVGPGIAVSDRRVFILPFGRFSRRPLSLLNPSVKDMLLEFLFSEQPSGPPPSVLDAPYVALFSYKLAEATVLLLVNASNDDYLTLRIRVPGLGASRMLETNRLRPQPREARCDVREDVVTLRTGLSAMEVKALFVQQIPAISSSTRSEPNLQAGSSPGR